MGFLSGIGNALGFGSGGNVGSGAQNYLSQIKPEVEGYFDPYIQAGQGQLPALQDQISKLLADPGAMLNQMGAGFQASPGYQYNVDQATQAAMNAGAASGQAGSPAVQQALAGQISGMASQDYNQWLNNALGLYGTGFGGSQQMAGQGLQAGSQLSDILSQALQSQAQADFAASQQQAQSAGGLLGSGGGLLGGLF